MNNIYGLLILLDYYLVFGIIGILINTKTKVPDEIKRKLLHVVGFASFAIFMFAFDDWLFSVITALICGIGAFLLISILEKLVPDFLLFFKERHPGEIKYTILIVFFVFAFSITLSWGISSSSLLGLIAIFGWGFGDMSASIIGTYLGKHHYKLDLLNKKTLEGSLASFIAVFVTSMTLLFIYNYSPLVSIGLGLFFGVFGSLLELFSLRGLDTFTMPIGLLLASMILYLI